MLSAKPAQALDPLNAASSAHLIRQDELGKTSSVWKKLPQLCVLEGSHLILSECPAVSADFGDEYQGSSNDSRGVGRLSCQPDYFFPTRTVDDTSRYSTAKLSDGNI